MGNTVRVIKSLKTGKVLNVSATNPEEGWIMVQSSSAEYRGGRRFENVRTGFLRQKLSVLAMLNLAAEFKALGVTDVPVLQPGGFAEGQLLPGRVVTQDSLKAIMDKNLQFGLRVPQLGNTPEQRTKVRTACVANGLSYMKADENGEAKPIYRKVFYSPYPEGHPRYEPDNIITPDNLDQVTAFISTIGTTPAVDQKAARIIELKAIPKTSRTAEQKAELAELLDA